MFPPIPACVQSFKMSLYPTLIRAFDSQIVLQCGVTHQLSEFSEPKPCVYVAALTAPEACRGDEHAALARTPADTELALAGLDACLESLDGRASGGNGTDSESAIASPDQCIGALSAVSTPVTLPVSPPPPPSTVAMAAAVDELIAVESQSDATGQASTSFKADTDMSASDASETPTGITTLS